MEAFPAFFPLAGRRVVIAGAGEAAEAKLRLFEGSPAQIVRLEGEAAADPAAYAGAALAFVAIAEDAPRRAAAAAARAAHVPLNVVDHPELCDFHTPAVIDRGQVVAAIGTGGAAPLLASLIRADVEARVPAGAGRLAALLQRRQDAVREAFPDLVQRRAFLRRAIAGPAAEAALRGDMAEAEARLDGAIAEGAAGLGGVSVVLGARTPELISLRAARVLAEADVVGGDEALLARHARRDAGRVDPADHAAIAARAAEGQAVALALEATDPALTEVLARAGLGLAVLQPAPGDA
ncbi:NAD(P)-dependent oxidoreductase [Caulobacter sp. KR2-114]|uniref:precorrin-2 dehydrogenase/sirohydrochlorin ferrochelatase family protein n=1 Tax=Caulobacter sp. KR2-114 TaxID=3400912 RepID=UPI003C02BD03